MATYAELYDLRSDDELKNKIVVAVVVKAQTILELASPTTAQVAWASEAIDGPIQKATSLMNYVLAANKALTVAQIQAAADSAVQANVDAAVDKIITGGV